MQSQYLALRWSTSRARDTEGYNVVTLTPEHGKRVSTCGGGYDMVGTVLGEWIEREHQDRLRQIAHRFAYWDKTTNSRGPVAEPYRDQALYGATFYAHDQSTHLDGACGDTSMEKIGNAIGLSFRWIYSNGRKQHRIGVVVTDERDEVQA